MVHKLCLEAQAHPEKKRGRYIQRMTPMVMMKKTLSVDLEAFAKEILEPHFHSGGPPKKVSRASMLLNPHMEQQGERANLLITVCHSPFYSPQHEVRPKHCYQDNCKRCWWWPLCGSQELWCAYLDHRHSSKPPCICRFLFQLWTSCLMSSQNIMGMSVVGGDYDQLKRYNLAELYSPTPKPQASEKKESETTESKP